MVELLAGVVGATWYADTSDILCLVEDSECAGLHHVHQFDKLHTEAKVRLVATESAHSLMPGHLLQFGRQFHSAHLLEEMACHILKQADDILLIHKAHLAVDLCELRLAVGSEVLVAEALGNLEIAVESAHHEQLLQCLRTLRQCIELSGIHARRHYEVACALGG